MWISNSEHSLPMLVTIHNVPTNLSISACCISRIALIVAELLSTHTLSPFADSIPFLLNLTLSVSYLFFQFNLLNSYLFHFHSFPLK